MVLPREDDERLREWRALLREGRAVLLGAVRQEILSGVRTEQQYWRLHGALREYADEPTTPEDYEEAARCFNRCRGSGIQGSSTDFLICAVALRLGAAIFTSDGDFALYARHLPLQLHEPRTAAS